MHAKRLEELSLSEIVPNRFQPRIHFDDEKIESLAKSIIRYGVLEPIIVRPVNGKYEIIAGERRFKASRIAGKTTIPSIIVDFDDKESIELALLENVQRQELTAIEEAIAYRRILDMGYITQEELAKKTGKSQPTIANKMRLLMLDDDTQEALINHKISERHARSLLKLVGTGKELEMLNRIIKERLTVRDTDDAIAVILGKKKEPTKEKVNKPNIDDFLGINTKDKKETPKVNFSNIETLFDDNLEKPKIKEEKGERGYMDIEKIMQEARDINASDTPKDMNVFISTPSPYDTIMGTANPNTNINEKSLVSPIEEEHNKFITVAPKEEEAKEEIKPEYQEPSVTFDSVFNSTFNTAAPAQSIPVVETPELNLPDAPTTLDEITAGIESIESILNSQPASVSAPERDSAMAQGPIDVTPTYETQMNQLNSNIPNINEEVNKMEMPTTQIKPNPSTYIKPEVNQNPYLSSIPEVPVSPVIETPVNTGVSDIPEFTSTIAESAPSINFPESGITTNAETLGSNIPEIKPMPDSNITNSVIETPVEPMSINSIISENTNSVDSTLSTPVSDFSKVLDIIKNCKEQIESLGYKVNMNEMDLSSIYQATFNIEKNN